MTVSSASIQYQYLLTVPYNGKYVHCLPLYIHTQEFKRYLYLHLKYITVHRTFSDTNVQLYNTIAVPYACTLKQYTFLRKSIQYKLY